VSVNSEPVVRPGTAGLEALCQHVGLRLEPFQKRIAAAAAGPEREFVALLPRGQGKTSLIAALALHHLLLEPDAAVYCAASSRDQARVLFEAAAKFARQLDDPHLIFRHLELRYVEDPDEPKIVSRHLRVVPADGARLQGLTPSLAIVDELHAHPDDEVYLSLRTAMLKRPGAKLIVISTAGQGADSPLGRLRARALAQPRVDRAGAFTDAHGPAIRMMEWSVPEDGDVDDAQIVKQANPASWVTADGLAEQRQAVPDLAYRRYHANQWTAREGHWLPPGAWQASVGQPHFTPGEPVWVGVDVGGERSASAVVWVNQQLHVGVGIYTGESGVLEVVDHVRALAAEFEVREVAFDPWRFGQAAQELEREGLTCVQFQQNDARMIPASSTLHAAVVEQRITLPDDPVLARHAADAVARHSRRGWRIDKPRKEINIDSIIALAMAIDRAENQPDPVQLLGWL
ncbi:MAG TPA: terminase large subunit, partial [Candidatus Limnocylindrales bacterium]|nr:terminase large subunit [Candidatus Limnocylindrales bacterium]